MNLNSTHTIGTPSEWLAARTELLAEEKQLSRQMDALSAKRRALPWVKLEKEYHFDCRNGRVSLADLFGGRSQLVVQHFMFRPGWKEGCPGCSFMADHAGGMLPHLAARDVALVAVSRAPLAEIEAFRKRMGWNFEWVSSGSSDFNFDFHVAFTEEELAKGNVTYNFTTQPFPKAEAPGISVFHKDAEGSIFHTYSTYGRGLELMMGTYRILDLTPKGRDEPEGHSHTWLRHHDRYGSEVGCGCHAEEATA